MTDEKRCECGHTQDRHTDDGCALCPSAPIWVDSLVDWVFPCSRFLSA